MYCAHHRTVFANRYCMQCGVRWCQACTVPKEYGHTAVETCARCGGLIRAFDPAAAAEARGQVRTARRLRGLPFFARPQDWFAFPLSAPPGFVAIASFGLLQAVIFLFSRTSILGLLGWIIFHGLVLSYLAYVVRKVDLGEERISAPTEFQGVWEEVYAPFGAFLVIGGPLIAAAVISGASWAGLQEHPVALGLLIYGLVMLPGGVVHAANYGTFFDLINPWKHLSLIWQTPVPYLASLLITALLFAIYVGVRVLLARIGSTFFRDLLDGAAHTYLGLVAARMFGLMIREMTPEEGHAP